MALDIAEARQTGMGTVITHRAFGHRAEAALRAAEAETRRLERRLSRFIPDSDISRVNASAGGAAVPVAGETLEVLSAALRYSRHSGGAFDATAAPLVSLWRVTGGATAAPTMREIKKALALVDFTALRLDRERGTAGLMKPGQSLDLGGVAKGYASDRIIEVFKQHGVESAFTNFGGNVSTLGVRPDGKPWRVGIRHPRKSGALAGAVDVAGRSVVTSGDDQRYFVGSDGRRYHHILDPGTGYPSDSGLISATVVSDSAAAADALSTALFVLGMEKGVEVIGKLPGTGAVMIGRDLTVTVTANLACTFTAADGVNVRILNH